jgi:hypothetical protein
MALKIVSTKDGLSRWLSDRSAITVTPGSIYEMSVYMRTSDVRDRAGLSANFWSSSGVYIDNSTGDSQQLRGSNGWTELKLRLTAPPQARFLRVEFRLTGTGTVWVDDVQVVRQ